MSFVIATTVDEALAALAAGARPVAGGSDLVVGARHGSNAALLVTRMLGLKNPDQFTATTAANDPHPWESGRVVDDSGREWKRLNVRAMLAEFYAPWLSRAAA